MSQLTTNYFHLGNNSVFLTEANAENVTVSTIHDGGRRIYFNKELNRIRVDITISLPKVTNAGAGVTVKKIYLIYRVMAGIVTIDDIDVHRVTYSNGSEIEDSIAVTHGTFPHTPNSPPTEYNRIAITITNPTVDNQATTASVVYDIHLNVVGSTIGSALDILGVDYEYDNSQVSTAKTTTTGPGTIDASESVHELTGNAVSNAVTLNDGVQNQRITILYVAEAAGGNNVIVTPTNAVGFNTITFSDVGDSAELIFGTGGWFVITTNGAVVA